LVVVGGREPFPGPAGCFAASVVARLGDDLAITDLPQDGTIAELLAYRDKIVASLSSTATVPQDELDTFGKRLGKVLLDGDIGVLYGEARREGVRINLVINDCLLQRIPWEYLCGPGEQPIPSRQRGIARVVACRRPNIDAHPVQNPGQKGLRVLLVVSREAGDTVVPLDEMTVALRQKFELRMPKTGVELEVKPVGTVSALSDAVTEPTTPWDVIQYLGHGEVRETRTGPVGGLRLVGNGANETFLSAQRLAALLSQKPPRLVMLTACNSAEARVAAPFANVAHALVMQGVPAVVANQMAIPADTVAEFCGGLFDQLLQSGDVDDAVSAARLRSYTTLARGNEDVAAVEWGIPVLHRALGSERIFMEFG
jgi:hypothetical protein